MTITLIYYTWSSIYTVTQMSNQPVRMVSLNVPEATLQQFDRLWKREGWESRQEAIVFLLRQSLARGYISKEKADVLKVISEGGDNT